MPVKASATAWKDKTTKKPEDGKKVALQVFSFEKACEVAEITPAEYKK